MWLEGTLLFRLARLLWPPAVGLVFGLIVAVCLRDGRGGAAPRSHPTSAQAAAVNVEVLPPSLPPPTLRKPRPVSARSARPSPLAPRPSATAPSAGPAAGDSAATRAARWRRARLELAATGEVIPPLR